MHRRLSCAFLIDFLGGEYQLGLMKGADDAAICHDIQLVTTVGRWLRAPSPIDLAQNDIYSHLRRPGTDAVVLASGCLSHHVNSAELAAFAEGFAPLPVASISVAIPGIPSLVIDNRRGQKLLVEHLIEKHGCRRIAYIRGPESSFEAAERLQGYREALALHEIAYDPALVLDGNFWITAGAAAVVQLLEQGILFDALVAANDYMALGAMDELKRRNLRVPGDVPVVGFDDIPKARMTSPSLTTMRQPLQRLGGHAIDLVCAMLYGSSVEPIQAFDVELVRRQSCGCGYRDTAARSFSAGAPTPAEALTEFRATSPALTREVLQAIVVPGEQWPAIVGSVVEALCDELAGHHGRFLDVLAGLLGESAKFADNLDQFYNIVGALRKTLRFRRIAAHPPDTLEDLWHTAVLLVAEWISRTHMRQAHDQSNAHINLRVSVERLSTALTHASLREALDASLPNTLIPSACLGIYTDQSSNQMRALVVTGNAAAADLHGQLYDTVALAPAGFFPTDRRSSFVLMPLTHGECRYGQVLFEMGEQLDVYSMLREQIGAALKATELHRVVVEETARRERAERQRLERETEIAQQIQTAILPRDLVVSGLCIAAVMQPATSVGGDYYDVIPTEDGCYLGIGDVTGHGLLAGLIMLMVQSMIAAATRTNSTLTPCQLLPAINRALYENVRHRLRETDHVTLTLLKYERQGRLLLAGAHDEVLIRRHRTGRCERLNVPGFWLGAIPDVTPMTHDLEVQLEDRDLIVLYTDGITEAMNEGHEHFGLDRLVTTMERLGNAEPASICQSVLAAVKTWSPAQLDDISLLVAKYDAGTGSRRHLR